MLSSQHVGCAQLQHPCSHSPDAACCADAAVGRSRAFRGHRAELAACGTGRALLVHGRLPGTVPALQQPDTAARRVSRAASKAASCRCICSSQVSSLAVLSPCLSRSDVLQQICCQAPSPPSGSPMRQPDVSPGPPPRPPAADATRICCSRAAARHLAHPPAARHGSQTCLQSRLPSCQLQMHLQLTGVPTGCSLHAW